MSALGPHNRLIVEQARAALGPLGLTQRGRSRSWIQDHGFWVVLVEFQSHKWDPGTFLNVGVCWLWRPKEYYTFDYGHRIGDFIPYKDDGSFMPPLGAMVNDAVEAVGRYDGLFQSPAHTADALVAVPLLERSEYKLFDAAMASGLAGRWDVARGLAEKIVACATGAPKFREPVLALHARARALLQAPDRLGATLGAIVEQSRAALKLPLWGQPVPTGQ